MSSSKILSTTDRKSFNAIMELIGTRVIRGPDWKWGDQDVGPSGQKNVGTIVRIFLEPPSEDLPKCEIGQLAPPIGKIRYGGTPHTVLVGWDYAPYQLYNYRTGYMENYDLCIFDYSSTACASTSNSDEGISGMKSNCQPVMFVAAEDFRPGEAVRVSNDLKELEKLIVFEEQKADARKVAGRMGVVHRTKGKAIVMVTFGDRSEYALLPWSLTKIFQKGDLVRITENQSIFLSEDNPIADLYGETALVLEIGEGGKCKLQLLHVVERTTVWLPANCLTMSRKEALNNRSTNLGESAPTAKCPGQQQQTRSGSSSNSAASGVSSSDEDVPVFPTSSSSSTSESEPDQNEIFDLVNGENLVGITDMLEGYPHFVAAQGERNQTPLHMAAMRGNSEVVECLLSLGSYPLMTDDDGDTPLHCAIHKGNAHLINMLVQRDAKCLNARNKLLLTPLQLAVRKQDRASVEILLKIPALEINCQDMDGDTPLHDAIKLNDSNIINLLINDGRSRVSLFTHNRHGMLPFHLMISSGCSGAIIRRILTAHPQLIREKLPDGDSVYYSAVINNNVEALALLLELPGSDVNMKARNGLTLLHSAVSKSRPQCVELLVEASADISMAGDLHKKTALHYAAEQLARKWDISNGTSQSLPCDCVQILQLQAIDDPNAKMGEFMDACGCEALSIMCYLLIRGANSKVFDSSERTPFEIIREKRLKPILERYILLGRFGKSIFDPDVQLAARRPEPTENTTCYICSEVEPSVVFEPCNHRLICMQCVFQCRRFKQCPRCSKAIDKIVAPDGEELLARGEDEPAVVLELRVDNQRLRDKIICPLCCDKEKAYTPPCGHSLCQDCAFYPQNFVQRYNECQFCRLPINGGWIKIKN